MDIIRINAWTRWVERTDYCILSLSHYFTKLNLTTKHQTQQTQNKTKLNVKTLRQHSLTTFTLVEKAVLSTHNLSVRKQVAE